MKYTYAYKTSDGQRHEAAMEAPSREVVFAELRRQGIRAIKVVAADGSKANGEIRGVRKRVVAIGAACLVAAAAVAVVLAFRAGDARGVRQRTEDARTAPRQQVYGDPAIIRALAADGYRKSFTNAWENFLVRHAVPGTLCPCNWKKSPLPTAAFGKIDNELRDAPPDASPELDRFVRIVNGMKAEAKAYLAAGGTVADYARLCCERVRTEHGIRDQADRQFARLRGTLAHAPETAEGERLVLESLKEWERQNALLRSFGLETVPAPED